MSRKDLFSEDLPASHLEAVSDVTKSEVMLAQSMGTIFKLFEGSLEREETTNLSRLTVPLTGHSIPPPPPPRLSTWRGPSASPPSIAGAEDDFLRGRRESLPSSSSSSRLRPRPAVKSPISEEGRPELESEDSEPVGVLI